MLKGGMGGGLEIDQYVEQPRPSLYNVIKKLKESQNRGDIVNRICYIAKVNENEFKNDMDKFEKEFTQWTNSFVNQFNQQAEDPNSEFRENNFDGTFDAQEHTGYVVILGGWLIHMFEAPQPLMGEYLKAL